MAPTKKTTTKVVASTVNAAGKFESMISRSSDAIIGDRGSRIVKSAKVAQRAIVDKLDQEVMTLEDKRDLMLDQSPDNRYSLTLGKSFEAESWASEYHSLSVKITNKKVELAIAQANYTDLFGSKSE